LENTKTIKYQKTIPTTNKEGPKVLYFVLLWESKGGSSMGLMYDSYMEKVDATK